MRCLRKYIDQDYPYTLETRLYLKAQYYRKKYILEGEIEDKPYILIQALEKLIDHTLDCEFKV